MSSFKAWLQSTPNSASFFENLAFTLGQRRSHHSHRHAVSVDSTESLRRILESVPVGASHGAQKAPVLAFVFTGQGAQYAQMASGLQMFDVFRQTMADAETALLKLGATWRLRDELLKPAAAENGHGNGEQVLSRIDDAEISQPVCTAVQLALIALLRSWGVMPAVVLGHSSGEIAAAYAANFISFEAALAIAYFRGLAASRVLARDGVKGAMLAVGASPQEAEKLFPPANSGDAQIGYATIAAVNSPESVTISGDISAIDYIHERAEEQNLFVRRLKVGVAYHSKHMDHVSASYLEAIEPFCSSGATKNPQPSETAFISSVTGEIETSAPRQAAYWVRNLLQPVLYAQAVQSLFSSPKGESLVQPPDVVIEVGPHAALQNPTKNILDRVKPTHNGVASQPSVQYLPSLVRGKDASKSMLDLAGKLFVKGAEIDLEAVNRTRGSRASVLHDLPPYEWNKTARYLHRPRVGTAKLFGGEAYHKLLGWQSPYTEGAEHAFRNVFTLDDLPWIRDHVVGGNTLFPFTGFVSLAVEAAKVVLRCAGGVEKPPGGFVLREFHVTSSLKIEEDQSVDMTTKLRPAEAGTKTSSATAWSFEILSWTEAGGWERHAYGLIEGEADSDKALSKSLAAQAGLKTLGDGSLRHLNADHEYELLQENYKVCYGPAFRTAVDFWLGPDLMVHTMVVRGIEPSTFMPDSPQHSPVTADPPTLDTILHSFGALQKGSGPRATVVPSYCREWRISNDIAATTGQRLSIVSRCLSHDPKSGNMELDFVVFDVGSSAAGPKAVAEIGPLKFQCIARPDPSELCLPDTFVSKNVPYLDLMDGADLVRAIERDQPADVDVLEAEISHRRDLDQAALHYISLALKEDYGDRGAAPDHLVGFSDWAEGILTRYPVDDSLDKDALLARVASSNATGELVCSVGKQLPSILRGEKQALEVMLENGLLWRTYAENVAGIRANVAMAGYLQRLLAVHPDLNILELGAGTASATLPVLQAIEKGVEGAEPTFTYTFTDISTGFFDKAREKLAPWSDRMIYKKLDIGLDPATQGFTPRSYDVVLASNVLHATPDILATLRNVDSLLRPGGKLVLMEGVVSPPPSFIPYALLPGWWLFEDDFRIDGPLLTKYSWDTALKTAGFSGLEGSVDDYPGRPEQLFSALWSTKLPPAQAAQPEGSQRQAETGALTIYRCSDSDTQCLQFAEELSGRLRDSMGKLPTTLPITDASTDGPCGSIPIIIDGKQNSIFGSTMTPEVYQKLKNILINNPEVLWVLPQGGHPDSSMIKGLLRTLRLELPSSRLVLLETPLDCHGAAAVEQLLKQFAQGPPSKLDLEQEYVLIDNVVHVPRVLLAADKRETFAIEAGLPTKTNQPLGQQERSLEATVEAVGSPDSVYFQHSDVLKNSHNLAPDQIIVEVEAAGLNFIDLLTVLGSLAWSPLGLEGVGTVRQVGSRVKGLSVGDRVIYAVEKAGMGTHVRMPRECAHAISSGMAAGDAASMPIAFSTAILTLLDVGRLRKEDSVLIHCASGATGQACLQIAQSLGCANIFVTAGTPEKRAFLAETYGIPTDHIFSSRNGDFKPEILAATSNRGVDVIVNCLSGSLLQQTWDLVADGGRFLEIGKKDLLENSHLSMRHFLRNVSFSGIDLRRTIATQPKTVQRYLSTIVRMLAEGAITPIRPVTLLPASRLTEGLRKLQGGKNIGKVVITFDKEDVILTESPSALKIAAASVANSHHAGGLLRHDGTYVIAGGTGGIGRALVPWMVEMGAKSVVMLGRSALSNPKVKAILKQFEGTDVVVKAIPCDVGSTDDIKRAVEAIKDLPKVCGVVHSAIALRVSKLRPV
jgi:acyl transferase domain-containing protein/NADPH:quinone reductase-like Zn-dependent oxidoreductase/SAM-dependent methyltransferase